MQSRDSGVTVLDFKCLPANVHTFMQLPRHSKVQCFIQAKKCGARKIDMLGVKKNKKNNYFKLTSVYTNQEKLL